MIYYVVFFTLTILSACEIFIGLKKKTKKIITIFVFLILLIICGTRWFVGTDFNHYLRLYKYYHTSHKYDGIEITYYIASILMPSFKFVLLFFAVIAVGLKIYTISKIKYSLFSILIYFSFMFVSYDMGRMRQGLAISFLFLSIFYLNNKKIYKFIVLILLAFLFHRSSILFIIVYPLCRIKLNKKLVITSLILTLILAFTHFDYYLIQILTKMPFLGKYSNYLLNGVVYYNFSFNPLEYRRIFLIALFIAFSNDNKIHNLLKIYIFGVIIFYIFRDIPTISERVSYYFTFTEIILIPSMLYNKSSQTKLILYSIFVVYCFYYLYITINTNVLNEFFNCPYLPYQSWLFN